MSFEHLLRFTTSLILQDTLFKEAKKSFSLILHSITMYRALQKRLLDVITVVS